MHPRAALLSLVLLSACSGSDSPPTDLHPSLASGGTGCTVTLTAAAKVVPPSLTTNSSGTASFTAKNVDCTINSNSIWSVSVTRTGTIATATISGSVEFVLDKGVSKVIPVNFTTGPTTGAGTITMRAEVDVPGALLIETKNLTVSSGPAPLGIPFGAQGLLNGTSGSTAPLTLSYDNNEPGDIVARIGEAQSLGVHIILVMTGGAHTNSDLGCCLKVINDTARFDRGRWDTRMAQFNTPAIRNAVAGGIADSTIIGALVMDEPYVHSQELGKNTWGPDHWMTKAKVDQLCGAVQTMFPGLRAGVEHQHQLFEPNNDYQVCQFVIDQYAAKFGDVNTWRNAGTAMAAREHRQTIFALNVLDGGVQDTDGSYTCNSPGQAGFGTSSPNCRMTVTQLDQFGKALVGSGCALALWKYNANYFGIEANKTKFQALADTAGRVPFKPCART